jgi:hypothetical protein
MQKHVRILISLSISFWVGCSTQQESHCVITDLKPNMQFYEVRDWYRKDLIPVSVKKGPSFDIAEFYAIAASSYDSPERENCYRLVFEVYPPLTKEQCDLMIQNDNVVDPNTISTIRGLEGYRPNRLVQVFLDYLPSAPSSFSLNNRQTTPSNPVLVPDAYGPGVHMNRYGQPVQLKPDFGGVPGEMLKIKPDAYGPGIHMDQYGRPVRETRWP